MLHSILGSFKGGLLIRILTILYMGQGGGGNDNSNYSIDKAKEVGPQSTKGVGYGHKGGQYLGCQVIVFTTEPGGIMEVAMCFTHHYLMGCDLAWT